MASGHSNYPQFRHSASVATGSAAHQCLDGKRTASLDENDKCWTTKSYNLNPTFPRPQDSSRSRRLNTTW